MIETRELTRRFGRVLAVDRMSWSVRRPGIVGLLGPNGAGKTTTMRMLTGFLPMTSGTAVVAGHDVFEAPLEVKARVGYLPETPPLYPALTVGEYLSFVAEIRGVERGRRAARVGEVLESTGLTGWERRRLADLSKGYRQRVGLAQALVHQPRLLILDEPTSGLDPAQQVEVRALVRAIAVDRTVVLSTHVLGEVEALCERVTVVHQGRIVGDGTVPELATQAGVGPWLELHLDAPVEDDLSPDLAALPEVAAVTCTGPGRYRLEGGEDADPAVSRLAAARGWTLRALTRKAPGLEQVFLRIVAGAP
jgi:ABC-2 type transport system ATP-binding protein